MQELITKLTEKAGISAEQATKAIDTIKDFVKEKFPMMSGAVDNLFASEAAGASQANAAPSVPSSGIMDKISDLIPGATREKVESFVKSFESKAEGFFDSAKDKISGMTGDKK